MTKQTVEQTEMETRTENVVVCDECGLGMDAQPEKGPMFAFYPVWLTPSGYTKKVLQYGSNVKEEVEELDPLHLHAECQTELEAPYARETPDEFEQRWVKYREYRDGDHTASTAPGATAVPRIVAGVSVALSTFLVYDVFGAVAAVIGVMLLSITLPLLSLLSPVATRLPFGWE